MHLLFVSPFCFFPTSFLLISGIPSMRNFILLFFFILIWSPPNALVSPLPWWDTSLRRLISKLLVETQPFPTFICFPYLQFFAVFSLQFLFHLLLFSSIVNFKSVSFVYRRNLKGSCVYSSVIVLLCLFPPPIHPVFH